MMDYPGTSGNPASAGSRIFFINILKTKQKIYVIYILLKNRSLTNQTVPHEIAVIGSDIEII